MKKIALLLVSFVLITNLKSQSLYFPPLTGNVWDSITPTTMGYCQPRIDSLYNYLQAKHSKSFIILKDGKRVLEKYFGTFTKDSVWYWASASKSLASFITGVAQQKGYININNKVSQYLGTGWTSETLTKENLITVKDLLQMTSGLNDVPPSCSNEDTMKACLVYKADASTRWAYHTGAYRKVQDVVSNAVALNYNTVTNNWIKTHIGMGGAWVQQEYYSKARDMARFGLLALHKGIWNTDTIMKDSIYFKTMTHTSQSFNNSYGYLWWLNGQTNFMAPGTQLVFPGKLIPNAPNDMFCALGKNDQKIYVIPNQNMVIIRQGNLADMQTLAMSDFDNVLWDYINKLNCSTSIASFDANNLIAIYPNPSSEYIRIDADLLANDVVEINIMNSLGEKVMSQHVSSNQNEIVINQLPMGMYFVQLTIKNTMYTKKLVVTEQKK